MLLVRVFVSVCMHSNHVHTILSGHAMLEESLPPPTPTPQPGVLAIM